MKMKKIVSCRSQGRLFYLFECVGSHELDFDKISIDSKCDGRTIPCGIYPADCAALQKSAVKLEGSAAVVVLPFLDGKSQKVEVRYENKTVASFCSNSNGEKWASRLNYRLKPALCNAIRDAQVSHIQNRYQPSFTRYLSADEGAVWRIETTWRGSADSLPEIAVFDNAMQPLDAEVYTFEFQPCVELHNGTLANKLFSSVKLSSDIRDFVVVAGNQNGEIAQGFCSMDGRLYNDMHYQSWLRMKDARADDGAYRTWFDVHRAKPGDIACQRNEAGTFGYQPLMSIVVPCYKTDKTYLQELIDSVEAQSYGNWELLLVDASPECGAVANACVEARDSRIVRIPLKENGGIVVNTNEGIAAAKGDYIAFLDHDDLLEPDALFRYARALNDASQQERPQVLFCDEDMFEKTGVWSQPVFKTDLNVDLLYSHNCVTHFLMVEAAFLSKIGVSPEDVAGAQDYDLVLRALAAGARFEHVPNVLYHWRIHSGSTADGSAESKPYAIEAGRLALQRHFASRGIAGEVEETTTPFVYRMRYELPTPAPLVSIVIPTKDHIETLDACITSIAEKSTYSNYEIVLVENNSTEQETFDYYAGVPHQIEELSKGRGTARVVTWPGEFNYPKIVNFGASRAKGEYLLLLNNDTEVISPDFIEEMMGYLQREDVGVVGAKLYYADGLTQHAGILVGVRGAIAHANQDFPSNREGYLGRAVRPGNFSAVTGACQMMRRELFEQLGGYDERFAVGFNDADFCLRAWEAGFKTVFSPYAELYHYEFTSRGREEADQKKLSRWKREQALFMQRWPRFFLLGDPFFGGNLDPNDDYFDLP